MLESGNISALEKEIGYLCKVFERSHEITSACTRLSSELSIYDELKTTIDLKSVDAYKVDNLHLFCFVPDDIVLIKPLGGMRIDDVASSLIIKPERIIYFGDPCKYDDCYSTFLAVKGIRSAVSFKPVVRERMEDYREQLRELTVGCGGRAVIEITGSAPMHVAAAMKLAALDTSIGVIRCDEKNRRVQNVANFDCVDLFDSTLELSANESYSLFGASEMHSPEDDYLYELTDRIPDFFSLYCTHREKWDKLVHFVSACGHDELEPTLIRTAQDQSKKRTFERRINASVFNNTCIEPVLRALEQKKAVSNIEINRSFEGFVTVKLETSLRENVYRTSKNTLSEDILSMLGRLFDNLHEQRLDFSTFGDSPDNFTITVSSGRYALRPASELLDNGYEDVLPNLEDFEAHGFVYIIRKPYRRSDGTYSGDLEFMYSNPAIIKMLSKTGNALEAYVWYAAKKSGYFDDIKVNFKFEWIDPDIRNELDVVLTKGLTSLVISCKAGKSPDNNHLYEIAYLTEHFTANSKAVITYILDPNYTIMENTVKRAAIMGISLISLSDLQSTDNLIDRLIQISQNNIENRRG